MPDESSLVAARRSFAEQIRALAGLRSQRLVDALATVAREDFVGPGPWQILRLPGGAGYEWTPDADPCRLYDNVLVALDGSRNLNNGEPAALLRWLDDLGLAPSDRMLHIGCGTGYYTALAAAGVPRGRVVGIELDPRLAELAQRNLARSPNATVRSGDGCADPGALFDAILVNAGATEPLPVWLEALVPGGRLLLPLTVGLPLPGIGAGYMLLVTRQAAGFAARFTSPVVVFDCAGARSDAGNRQLAAAYARGGLERVQSLRESAHAPGLRCWLHGARVCLSAQEVGSTP